MTINDVRECLINHLGMIASFKSEIIGTNQSQQPQQENEMKCQVIVAYAKTDNKIRRLRTANLNQACYFMRVNNKL